MPFWDFLSKLLGKPKPTPGTAAVSAAPVAPSEPLPASPAPPPPPVRAVEMAVVPENPPPPPPPPAEVGPKAGDFLPVSRDELLTTGEEVRRTTGWMFFGRRDMIPPVSDP